MSIQTKLSKAEKANVRVTLAEFEHTGGYVFSFPGLRTTVAIAPVFERSRMARASVSLASPTETKFRKLVGIDRAMFSLTELDQSVPVVLPEDFWSYSLDEQESVLEEIASNLAFSVSGA